MPAPVDVHALSFFLAVVTLTSIPVGPFQVVGVADPREFARKKLQQQHNIEDDNVFEGDYHNKSFTLLACYP